MKTKISNVWKFRFLIIGFAIFYQPLFAGNLSERFSVNLKLSFPITADALILKN